jgi:hypothetical protein
MLSKQPDDRPQATAEVATVLAEGDETRPLF